MSYGENIMRYKDRDSGKGRKYAVSWHEYDEDAKRWVYDWCIPCTLQGAHLALYFDSRLDIAFIIEEIKPM